ncbi:hypothetical protein MMC26_007112 [Xylographa opegraphella]|nr:hypothetical protein [Xylographa opegraphella]
MRAPHALLPLLLFTAVPLNTPVLAMAGIPYCLSSYGPVTNADTIHAINQLSNSFSHRPGTQVRVPLYYHFASALVGLDVIRTNPLAVPLAGQRIPLDWNAQLRSLQTVRQTCVAFQGGLPYMREWGGWMHDNGFIYVVVNALEVGDVTACLQRGTTFEACIVQGLHASAARHGSVIDASAGAVRPPAGTQLPADDDPDDVPDVQGWANAMMGMY